METLRRNSTHILGWVLIIAGLVLAFAYAVGVL